MPYAPFRTGRSGTPCKPSSVQSRLSVLADRFSGCPKTASPAVPTRSPAAPSGFPEHPARFFKKPDAIPAACRTSSGQTGIKRKKTSGWPHKPGTSGAFRNGQAFSGFFARLSPPSSPLSGHFPARQKGAPPFPVHFFPFPVLFASLTDFSGARQLTEEKNRDKREAARTSAGNPPALPSRPMPV